MSRGKGIKDKVCYCQTCRQNFLACREDAATCSPKCRKARNRLLGGSDIARKRDAVTDIADDANGNKARSS
jgi:Zn finger protein HypA/HybF involved in hydrogenase expression